LGRFIVGTFYSWDVLGLGSFGMAWDVWMLWMFWSWDILGVGMFWGLGHFVAGTFWGWEVLLVEPYVVDVL
jgi:hypothetical protein